MATTKKAPAKKTTAKKPTAKAPAKKTTAKAAAKTTSRAVTAKAAPRKSTSSKTSTVRRAPAKKQSSKQQAAVRSFRIDRSAQPSFTTFRITRQTVYWIFLVAFIVFVQLWILKLQMDVVNLLDAQQLSLEIN